MQKNLFFLKTGVFGRKLSFFEKGHCRFAETWDFKLKLDSPEKNAVFLLLKFLGFQGLFSKSQFDFVFPVNDGG